MCDLMGTLIFPGPVLEVGSWQRAVSKCGLRPLSYQRDTEIILYPLCIH